MYKVKFEKEMNKLKKSKFGNHQHYIFYNKNIKSDEKILLIDLLNNNSKFNSNISGISYFTNLLDCNKDKIFNILNKLEKKGYIVRKKYFVNTPTKKSISEIHIQLHIIISDYVKQIEEEEKLKEKNIQQETEFIRIEKKDIIPTEVNEVNVEKGDIIPTEQDSSESVIIEDKSQKEESTIKETKVSQNQNIEELEVESDSFTYEEETNVSDEVEYEDEKNLLRDRIEEILKDKGFTYTQILFLKIEEKMDLIDKRFPKLHKDEHAFFNKVMELISNK